MALDVLSNKFILSDMGGAESITVLLSILGRMLIGACNPVVWFSSGLVGVRHQRHRRGNCVAWTVVPVAPPAADRSTLRTHSSGHACAVCAFS